jgi:hypothetical protein
MSKVEDPDSVEERGPVWPTGSLGVGYPCPVALAAGGDAEGIGGLAGGAGGRDHGERLRISGGRMTERASHSHSHGMCPYCRCVSPHNSPLIFIVK